MKSNKQKSKITVSVIVAVAIVFVGIMINLARGTMYDAMIESTISELSHIGAQIDLLLGDAISEGVEDLEIIADAVAENDADEEDIISFINSYSQSTNFESLYYIDINGNGISLNGEMKDFSDDSSYLSALDNEFSITDPHVSFDNQIMVFGLAVPVNRDGEVIAVLLSEIAVDEFFAITTDERYGISDIFIVDRELNLIFSSSENHLGTSFIPEGDISEMGIENVNQAREDIIACLSGSFTYDYYGVTKAMVYHPIDRTEWAVAMNIEVDKFSELLTNAIQRFDTTAMIVYWTVVLLVIYITIYQHFSHKSIIKAAYYDSLTELPNLEMFKTLVAEKLRQYPDVDFVMQKMDISKFSMVNEVFDMKVGDKLLVSIANVMKTIEKDIERTFVCAKVGIDEFIMFGENNYLDREDDERDADELLVIEMVPELAGYDINFRYGRYFIEKGESDVMDMITKTTIAHNMAKLNTQRKTWNYDETYKQEMLRHAEINNKRKAALENDEFKVYFQPKFSALDNKLVGAEALVRWIESDGNMIYPNDFIPLFERNGFIVDIDRLVLMDVCKTMRNWLDKGYGELVISVNCSRLNLENPFFVDGVIAIVDKYSIPHRCIEIELTESITIQNESSIEQIFSDLRTNGFRISIDDFGAGYSSLGMLKNLHVDTLKMDRSFFVGGKNARRDDMLIDSIVKMSHSLGMFVVAEGIETKEQVDILKSMNCDAIQGYVYSKPISIMDFEEKYKEDMLKNDKRETDNLQIINNINDAKLVNSLAPCGLLIAEVDEYFTIVEANDFYFDMIGFTREEVRDKFQNRGINLMDESSREEVLKYFENKLSTDSTSQFEFISKFRTKAGKDSTYQLSGKMIVNENGKMRLYFSSTDITEYVRVYDDLERQQNFVSDIASFTGSSFYEYDINSDTIRFSKNFADQYNIPQIIKNFTKSQLAKDMFATCVDVLGIVSNDRVKRDGEFCITLQNGKVVWHTYSCEAVYNEELQGYRVVGKISQIYGNNLEMDILKVKSNTQPMLDIYNKEATQRYIRNYLRTATESATGAFFVVEISSFDKVEEKLGTEIAEKCIKDISDELRLAFRSTDIIGRVEKNKFFVFINNFKTIDFVLKKADEISTALRREYLKDGVNLTTSAKIGISLYPKDGDNFDSIYQKADSALKKVSAAGECEYLLFSEDCNNG